MSNMKRFISAMMAVLMVLSVFSCLFTTNVFAAFSDHTLITKAAGEGTWKGYRAADADWQNVTSSNFKTFNSTYQSGSIKTIDELDEEYGDTPYVYVGLEVYEKDDDGDFEDANGNTWSLTDHYVQPDDELLLLYYVKENNFELCTFIFDEFFTRSFFDVNDINNAEDVWGVAVSPTVNSSVAKFQNSDDPVAANKTYVSQVKMVDLEHVNTDNPIIAGEDDDPEPALGMVADYAGYTLRGNLYFSSDYKTKVTTTGSNAETLHGNNLHTWDYQQYQFDFANTDVPSVNGHTDEWLFYSYAAVRGEETVGKDGSTTNTVPEGAIGEIGMDWRDDASTSTKAKTYFETLEEVYAGDYGAVVDTTDANAVFMIGKPSEGGDEETTYTATFYDGSTQLSQVADLADGDAVTFPADPTKDGATFLGWATSADSTATVTSATIDGADASFYAVWGYALSFVNGVTGAAIGETTTVAAGAAITYPTVPTNEGYTFAGWSSEATTMPAAATTITANYNAKEYTVTFQKADGSVYSTAKVAYGAVVTAPADDPEVDGETFTGWTYSPALGAGNTMPASDVTATPNYSTNSYTITYKTADGADYTTASYSFGATVAEIGAPDVQGNTFTGWTYTPALGTGNTMPNSNVTATPNYELGYYELTVNADGGTGAGESASIAYGTNLADYLGTPEKSGYTFVNWTYATAEGAYTGTTMPDAALTATANYTAIDYTITFVPENGEASYTATYNVGNTVTAATPEFAGYDFNGWTYSPALGEGNTMPASDVTATASWTPKQITLTFVIDGATTTDTQTFGQTVAFPTVTNPTGKTYTGWTVASTNTFVADADLATVTVPATAETYTAKLIGNKHTVTFNVDGAEYTTATVAFGDTITAPEYTAAAGWKLSAWTDADGNELTAATTMPDNDVVYNATTSRKSYTLTFDLDNGSDPIVSTVTFEDAITYPTEMTKTGYAFASWSSNETTMPASDLTITAIWTKNAYTLTIDAAGGTCDTVTGDVYFGDAVTIADPSREGYTFTGWTYSPELGEGNTMPASAVTATATWEIHTHTVTYMIRTGETGEYTAMAEPVSYDFGATVPVGQLPELEGYIYNQSTGAWADENGTAITGDFVMGDADVVLYATAYIQSYTDTWYDYDGNLYTTTTEVYNADITAPVVPGKEGYEDLVWDPTPGKQAAGNMTFRVIGSAGASTYIVEIYEQTTDGDENYDLVETIDTRKANTDSTATYDASDLIREGFTYNEDMSIPEVTVTADGTATIELYFDRVAYTLTVVDNAGTTEIPVLYGAEITVPEAADREGYSFTTWKWTKTAGGNYAAAPTTMPAEGVTITAGYKINSYKINYVVDGAAYSTADTVQYLADIPAKAYTAPEGYAFSGWTYTDAKGNEYTGTTMPASDLTATGENEIQSYTITFMNGTEVYGEPITQNYGTPITVPDGPTVAGKKFLSWSPAVPETMPASNMTVYAQFSDITYYAIFMADGKQVDKVAYHYGDTIADTTATFSKQGYTFAGWDKELGTMGEEDITFTATWTAKAVTATFYAVDGDADVFATVNGEYDAAIAAPEATPERASYVFKGWKLQGTSNSAIVSFPYTVNAESLTFVGVWEQDTSAVLVESVQRITTGYYDKGVAQYKVTLKENVTADYVYITLPTKTYEFSKGTFENYGSDVSSVISIDNSTGKEVWVVEAMLAAAEDTYTAYITTTEGVTETNALTFDVAYDTKSEDVVKSEFDSYGLYTDATCETAATQVVKGEYLYWKFVTADDVTWIKLVGTYTTESGESKTLATLYKSTTTSSNVTRTVDTATGTATWVIRMRFTYSVEDLKIEEAFAINYRVGTKTNYYVANEGAPVNVTIGLNEDVLNPVTVTYDPYTLISVAGPETATKNDRAAVTVVTTSDCTKVRIGLGTKYATFQHTESYTSANCSVVDNGDGTITWTINYKFATAGTNTYTVNARGTAWGEALNYSTVVA